MRSDPPAMAGFCFRSAAGPRWQLWLGVSDIVAVTRATISDTMRASSSAMPVSRHVRSTAVAVAIELGVVGCGEGTTGAHRASAFIPAAFFNCLGPHSEGVATTAAGPSAAWERGASVIALRLITFTPVPDSRSIWSSSDITASTANAAFFSSTAAAQAAAGHARKQTSAGVTAG